VSAGARGAWREDPLLSELGSPVAGPVSPATRVYVLPEPFELESGVRLPRVEVAYRTWGRLDREGRNGVLVCHALTGSADVDAWWSDLLGPGRALDPDRDFVVASNVLGSCYGTTGPRSPVDRGLPAWGGDFPRVTVRDMVALQARLLEHLGVERLQLVVGGSLGGMQVLEWAALHGDRIDAVAPIAVGGRHSAWAIALSAAQRQAIVTDPRWLGGHYPPHAPPVGGLAAARMIAMCSYRSRASFEERFARESQAEAWVDGAVGGLGDRGPYAVEGYLRHQGRKLVDRFDANSYVALTHAMDSHDLGRGRGRYEQVLRSLAIPALVVAIDSDVLYPPIEQRELASLLPHAELAWLRSQHGHDAFLLESAELDRLLLGFRREVAGPARRRRAGRQRDGAEARGATTAPAEEAVAAPELGRLRRGRPTREVTPWASAS
jgi:homoserine O-acetyltransferase